jgi:predicted secreted protein
MPSQKGRDLLLKIGDGAAPESFTALGAARAVEMTVSNQPVDATTMDSGGLQLLQGEAGVQSLRLRLEGLFRDAAAEERLRAAAFARSTDNYELWFPNGDRYAAAFTVQEYQRGGAHDGLETFAVTLARSGGGAFTPGE